MFIRKSISAMPRRRSYFLKYMTMFFLGASATMLATQAINISTSLSNAVQYIQKIVITSDGTNSGTTGIVLDGNSGNAFFSGNVGIGTGSPSEKLTVVDSGAIFSMKSADWMGVETSDLTITSNPTYEGLLLRHFSNGGGSWIINQDNILSLGAGFNPSIITLTTGGYAGIGTTSPANKLAVGGSVNIQDALYIGPSIFGSGAPGCGTAGTCGLGLFSRDVYSIGGDFSILGGDVGIGYDVGNASTSNNLYISGNVGIGTNTPTEKFQISDYAWIGKNNPVENTGGTFLKLYGYSPASQPLGYNYTPNILLDYYDNQAIGNKSNNWKMTNDGDFSISYATGNYEYDEKFTISNNGNVGIGTANPQYMLSLGASGGKIGYYSAANRYASISFWTGQDMVFSVEDGGHLGGNFIFEYGKVGIGTDSPGAKLTVDGGIQAKTIISDPCQDQNRYPQGTMFFVPGSNRGIINYKDMYCFCNGSGIAQPINGSYINYSVTGGNTIISAASDICFP